MALIVLFAIVMVIELLAWFFGADSRDHRQPEFPLSGFRDAVR